MPGAKSRRSPAPAGLRFPGPSGRPPQRHAMPPLRYQSSQAGRRRGWPHRHPRGGPAPGTLGRLGAVLIASETGPTVQRSGWMDRIGMPEGPLAAPVEMPPGAGPGRSAPRKASSLVPKLRDLRSRMTGVRRPAVTIPANLRPARPRDDLPSVARLLTLSATWWPSPSRCWSSLPLKVPATALAAHQDSATDLAGQLAKQAYQLTGRVTVPQSWPKGSPIYKSTAKPARIPANPGQDERPAIVSSNASYQAPGRLRTLGA